MKETCIRRAARRRFSSPTISGMTRPLILCTVLIAIVNSSAQQPGHQPELQQLARAQEVDDLFLELGKSNPAFGGMFLDEKNRVLYIYSKDSKAVNSLSQRLEAIVGPSFVRRLTIRVLAAQYSFVELKEWQERITAEILAIPGIVLIDVDDTKNRLTIGVETLGKRRAIEGVLRKSGVPRAAVNIRVTAPVRLESSLRDRHRPVLGGLQISRRKPRSRLGICTYGFSAERANVAGFVTNAHCTATRGRVDSTVFYQGRRLSIANRVGVEIADPAYFTGGACPVNRRCRRSDSAFVQRDMTAAGFAGIARPALNSRTWNGINRFRIVAEGATIVGMAVTKVGRTTGRTQGVVEKTCFNANIKNTNTTLLCQSSANYRSSGGDSGSPVFRIINSPLANDVHLVGIHWGGGFSSMANIQEPNELGLLNTECVRGELCSNTQKCCEMAPCGGCLLCVPLGASCP